MRWRCLRLGLVFAIAADVLVSASPSLVPSTPSIGIAAPCHPIASTMVHGSLQAWTGVQHVKDNHHVCNEIQKYIVCTELKAIKIYTSLESYAPDPP